MAELQLRTVDGRGRPIKLDGEPITIGRHPDNRLRIKADKASRHHAVIEPAPDVSGGSFRVRDLGSRNGTKLNGMKVTESVLSVGDVISVGGLELRVEDRDADDSDRKLSSKRRVRANGAAAELNEAWARDIRATLDAFPEPPKVDENVRLIDASGDDSDALSAPSHGPQCLRLLLRVASRTTATDVHVEPKGDSAHIRMRVDGVMVWIAEIPNEVYELLVGLVRTACHMPQAAKTAVLDGHFSTRFPDRRIEYRVSLTPSVHGSKLVIRVLDQRGVPTAIEDLGLVGYMREKIQKVCSLDAGMLLVCGPTGSGKTTTLYNCLREIDRDARNVVTIEDPVEYQIDNVTQMPINEKQGATFYSMLRSVLRQDPDVILLGEIRDEDTARTAMQAAMTGHLVFSTVHSKDTVSAVFRLLDLKVEPYLVANSLSLVLAQRLLRRLCPHCKAPAPLQPGQATRMGRYANGVTEVHTPVGCKRCLKTGYRGRQALFELLEVSDDLRDVILSNPNISAIKKIITEGHFTTLSEFGWKLVADGQTSVEEVERVAGSR
ncbi:MAG: type II secretion system protein GspE [Phycisphaerae bacterium]|nr:type II secretion system protein GspE [Phycisphaerae bacterium]